MELRLLHRQLHSQFGQAPLNLVPHSGNVVAGMFGGQRCVMVLKY